jgi:hypothetical protein
MQRRTLLARGGLVGTVGLAGCLSRFTGGGAREFRPAVESFNRGIDAFDRAESTRSAAEERYADERWDGAAQRYTAARDGYDAAATEFDSARSATSGRCVAVHDRAVRQYRRSLALVEACDHWADAATAWAGGLEPASDERRARVWRDRAAQYPSATRFDPEQFSCRA